MDYQIVKYLMPLAVVSSLLTAQLSLGQSTTRDDAIATTIKAYYQAIANEDASGVLALLALDGEGLYNRQKSPRYHSR